MMTKYGNIFYSTKRFNRKIADFINKILRPNKQYPITAVTALNANERKKNT